MERSKILNSLLLLVTISSTFVCGNPVLNHKLNIRLIQIGTQEAKWMKHEEINALTLGGIHYMDITNYPNPVVQTRASQIEFPTETRFQEVVTNLFIGLNPERLKQLLTEFSAYPTRYYTSETGAESSEWLFNLISGYLESNNYTGNASVTQISHAWPQKSIVAKLVGSDPTLTSEVVILGAHLDSTSGSGLAPGADDDGSGTFVVLSTLSAFLRNNFIPKRTVEFHWYAAEEDGLLGSQEIAANYALEGINVVSMVQFDVIGWSNGQSQIGLVRINTDGALTDFLQIVTESYLDYTWKERLCQSGCTSDHYSWARNGYPVAMGIEPEQNPYMHTSQDTVDYVNFELVNEFSKLAIGYAVELAEPYNSEISEKNLID